MSEHYRLLISDAEIEQRIAQLAERIDGDLMYLKNPRPLTLLVVLNGAMYFAADLSRKLSLEHQIDTIRVESYKGNVSTGNVEFEAYPKSTLFGRDVLIVEDIVDTGNTLHVLRSYVARVGAHSCRTVTLLFKPDVFKWDSLPEYVGFSVPNRYVVGYGMDDNETRRHLPNIYYKEQ